MNKIVERALNRIKNEVSEACYCEILSMLTEECEDKVIRVEKDLPEEKEYKSCLIKKGKYKISEKPVKI